MHGRPIGAVAIYPRDIAERMGLGPGDPGPCVSLRLVHDIGKMGCHPACSRSPARSRSRSGGRCRSTRRSASAALPMSTSTPRTHGSYDITTNGSTVRVIQTGTTDGGVPLVSRIIAVADAYNAMTSDRPYRDAIPSRVARLRFAQAADSQLDTSVVAAFEAILAGSEEAYRGRERRDFRGPQSTYESASTPVYIGRRRGLEPTVEGGSAPQASSRS